MERRRRLPVLQSSDVDVRPRPPWQWVAFGVGAIVVAWVPLTAYAMKAAHAVVRSIYRRGGHFAAPLELPQGGHFAAPLELSLGGSESAEFVVLFVSACAFVATAAGALAGGYVVGRWGPPSPVRMGGLAGIIAGALAGLLSLVVSGTTLAAVFGSLLIVIVAASGGAIGAWLGARRRPEGFRGVETMPDA